MSKMTQWEWGRVLNEWWKCFKEPEGMEGRKFPEDKALVQCLASGKDLVGKKPLWNIPTKS